MIVHKIRQKDDVKQALVIKTNSIKKYQNREILNYKLNEKYVY